jgi:16S rRNA (adenine1518-N6/adenine1519-N6)-dimethyltransferase
MKAKKSLGQNFLKSKTILNKIVEAGKIQSNDTILEIGPGRGALTEKLLESGASIIAIEKDNELYEFLKNKFEKEIQSGSLVLVNGDILNFDPSDYDIIPGTYKIIANIPYNITGAILKKFLSNEDQPESMVLMVQHEVAKRILANDKKESILSISVKAYGEPKMVIKVGKEYFSPKPKVDSAVIKINNINREIFKKNDVDEEKFWQIVHAGFAHKRKKLRGNLKNILELENSPIDTFGDKRAEDLSLLNWISLASSKNKK